MVEGYFRSQTVLFTYKVNFSILEGEEITDLYSMHYSEIHREKIHCYKTFAAKRTDQKALPT